MIADAAGVTLTVDDFERIRTKVPVLCDLKPSGKYVATDLHRVGGVPLIMKMLLDRGLLHGDCMTITGQTIAEALKPLGYRTGQFGKNHLGDRNEHLPTVNGFDEFYGNLYHLNAEEEPEQPDYPKDPAFKKRFGPRGVLHCKADGKGGGPIKALDGSAIVTDADHLKMTEIMPRPSRREPRCGRRPSAWPTGPAGWRRPRASAPLRRRPF